MMNLNLNDKTGSIHTFSLKLNLKMLNFIFEEYIYPDEELKPNTYTRNTYEVIIKGIENLECLNNKNESSLGVRLSTVKTTLTSNGKYFVEIGITIKKAILKIYCKEIKIKLVEVYKEGM